MISRPAWTSLALRQHRIPPPPPLPLPPNYPITTSRRQVFTCHPVLWSVATLVSIMSCNLWPSWWGGSLRPWQDRLGLDDVLALLAWKLSQWGLLRRALNKADDELLGTASSPLLVSHFNVGITIMYIVFIFTLPSRVQFIRRQSFKRS